MQRDRSETLAVLCHLVSISGDLKTGKPPFEATIFDDDYLVSRGVQDDKAESRRCSHTVKSC